MAISKKTHQQLHAELREAANQRYIAEKAGDQDGVARLNQTIAELRAQLPPPKGTKARWK